MRDNDLFIKSMLPPNFLEHSVLISQTFGQSLYSFPLYFHRNMTFINNSYIFDVVKDWGIH